MKRKDYYIIGILSAVIGGIIASLAMAGINQKIDLGSVADWLNLILVGATVLVTWIIFKRQTSSHLEIAAGTRNIQSKEKNGVITGSAEKELVFWITNDGNATGSFKFVGFVLNEKDKKFRESDTDNRLKQMVELDPKMLFEEREFITLKPNTVSENMAFPISAISQQFQKDIDSQKECLINACWMDAVGKIYTKQLNF
ncbi:hypothetical protein [Lactiplantibacillus plantarum]|uniref:hypothetical protein n=1 Tax=Lactiplantibacillus plantarum TaxID=1590 RepID=UPI00077E1C08|nr:hypothetical protein [Lactiplantibacillus plantarum]AMR18566.1 hypothetical protein AZF39_00563 [Lactiplantibacillus plantarum]MDB7771005.1 hypothetical protein [Lactiplantibacillus plantarum]MDN7027308.1 hypothetical protein [Lactiplantibacillus plantarum]QIA85656.1 hypothetical protein FEE41_10725 [Lactiplantibacillus plantarum]QTL11166.1 hypothetical protein J7V10_11955 [Lactiplantibacillus plantarum]